MTQNNIATAPCSMCGRLKPINQFCVNEKCLIEQKDFQMKKGIELLKEKFNEGKNK